MRRTILAAAVAACMAVGVAPAAAHHGGQHEYMERRCRYGELDPGVQTQREMRATIECAVRRWPVPGGLSMALLVASHESGLQADAYNSSSGACGIYQHLIRYWPGRQDQADRPWMPIGESCKNGRANIIVSIRIAHRLGWESNWCRWASYC